MLSQNHANFLKEEAKKVVAEKNVAQIKATFESAIETKNWPAVKVICEMPDGPAKPIQANKSLILKRAIDTKQWEDAFHIEKVFKKSSPLKKGPLPKSIYTTQLEELTRQMLQSNGDNFIVEKKNGEDIIVFPNDKGTSFNWTEIRANADLQHITLEKTDFDLYKNYMALSKYPKQASCSLDPLQEKEYRELLYKQHDYQHLPRPDPPITFAEMQALNIYTGDFHEPMNALLRGKITGSTLASNKQQTRAALIQSVMCASALRKLPQTFIQDTYRASDFISESDQKKQVIAAATQGVISLTGFVSTTTHANRLSEDDVYNTKSIRYHFKNLTGTYIAPISQCWEESEFLIPPTLIQLTNYKIEDNIHYFAGDCVSGLSCLSAQSLDIYLKHETITSTFELALFELENKVEHLKTEMDVSKHDKDKIVYFTTHELLETLKQYKSAHFSSKTMSKAEFEINCDKAVDKAKPILEQNNRSWKNFLTGSKAAIHAAADVFTGTDFLQHPAPTTPLKAVEKFKRALASYKESDANLNPDPSKTEDASEQLDKRSFNIGKSNS